MHLRYLQERLRIRQGSCSINKGTATQRLCTTVHPRLSEPPWIFYDLDK